MIWLALVVSILSLVSALVEYEINTMLSDAQRLASSSARTRKLGVNMSIGVDMKLNPVPTGDYLSSSEETAALDRLPTDPTLIEAVRKHGGRYCAGSYTRHL